MFNVKEKEKSELKELKRNSTLKKKKVSKIKFILDNPKKIKINLDFI